MNQPEHDPIRERHEKEVATRNPKRGKSFAGDHRLARMYKFAGEQARKTRVEKSRRKMRKASQRRNRS